MSAMWLTCWLMAFALTHIPIKPGGLSPIPHLDKFAHVILYFVLSYLGGLRLLMRTNPIPFHVLLVWALVYIIYGAVDELTQPFTGREADVADWAFDAIGVGLATFSLWRGLVPKWVQRT